MNILSRSFGEFKVASWAFFHTQGFWKYFLIAFSLYGLGILSLIRADVYYIDDLNRAIIGYKEWENFSRYISWFLSSFMHMDSVLSDVSPLTQLVAIAFLSFSSLILVWSVREVIWKNEDSNWESSEIPYKKRLTTLGIIASIPLGLSPYFLEELSFKYDSPYMALSVLFSVIPFVFIHHIRAYVPVSILCLLGMCMTYQASSGIEVILVLFFAFLMFNQTNAGVKKAFTFIGVSALNYIIALGIFKFFIMHENSHAQASTAILKGSDLISGFLRNLDMYLNYLWSDFGLAGVKICVLVLLGFFVISAIYQARINKILSCILALVVLSIGICLSYGTYLVLEQPLTRPRAFIGIGVFVAALSVYVVSAWRGWAYKQKDQSRTNSTRYVSRPLPQRVFYILSAVIAIFCSWSLVVFANSYGNALSQQNEYQKFRLTVLLNDLVNATPHYANSDNYLYRIKGWVTASPALENASKHYPIMKRLVTITDTKYWVRTAMKHYGWGEVPEEQLKTTPETEDFAALKEDPRCDPATAGKRLKLIDNIYHKIEVYSQCTLIEFKGKERYIHEFDKEVTKDFEERLNAGSEDSTLDSSMQENVPESEKSNTDSKLAPRASEVVN